MRTTVLNIQSARAAYRASVFALALLGLAACSPESSDKPAVTAAPSATAASTDAKSDVVLPKADKANLFQPEYPAEAKAKGQQGVVQLNLHVLSTGAIDDVKVEKSSGFPQLDDYAVRAARRWRMTPGTVGGKPETMWHTFRVTYKLD